MFCDDRSTLRAGALGLLALALLVGGGCGARQPRPRTVDELAADPTVLQGLMARCAADGRLAANDAECVNARFATERLGRALDAEKRGLLDEEFARQREQRRLSEDARSRAAAEAQPRFDPYSAPVPPVAPTPQGAPVEAAVAGTAGSAH